MYMCLYDDDSLLRSLSHMVQGKDGALTMRQRDDKEIASLEARIAAELVEPSSYPDVKKFHELPLSNYTLQGTLVVPRLARFFAVVHLNDRT